MCTRISRQFIIPLPLTFWYIHADTPGKGRKIGDARGLRSNGGGEKVERDESGGSEKGRDY